MADRPKVLILDGHSVAYRAFFALPDTMTTADGRPTNAIYGFTSMLLKVLSEERPRALVVALDGPRAELHRTQEYPEYKAHRPPMPEGMRQQMGEIEELLKLMKVPVFRVAGYEADDVIGTVARMVADSGESALIVTGDRDALQLVDDDVRVLMTGKGISETVTYDRASVEEKYGVPPASIPDIKALTGDSSDNIPGVPGIGEKGAKDLIGRFGSLDGLYENLDSVTGARRKSALEQNRDLAYLSRRLATIHDDLSIELDLSEAELGRWNIQEVVEYLMSLDFRTLARRFLEIFGEGEECASGGDEILYSIVDQNDQESLGSFADEAREDGRVSVAADLSGSGFCDIELRGLALATGCRALVTGDLTGNSRAARLARELLASCEVEKVLHNAKSALGALGKLELEVGGELFDTAVAAYLLNPSLGAYETVVIWERERGGRIKVEGKDVVQDEQPSLLVEAQDGDDPGLALEAGRVYHLRDAMEVRLGSSGMASLFREIEMPLVLVLEKMERAGIALDHEVLVRLSEEAGLRLAELEAQICSLAGREFNVASTKQMAEVLFGDLGLTPLKKTKTGYSTDSSVLETLREEHPIAEKILEYRENSKLKSTYFDVLPELICERTGRLHCSFNQTATATGRISSSNPNLQNIPVRSEAGRRIRAAFVAGHPGWKLVVADYSQIELRVLAHLSRDPLLLDAFASDVDIHSETAAKVFGVGIEDVTPEMRRMAKVVNFGVVYGMGYFGLSSRLGISMEDATHYIDTYFETYSGVREYRARCIEQCRSRGYSETLFGRRRYIPELESGSRQQKEFGERLAVNTPIQGTAADIIKKAMVTTSAELERGSMDSAMLLQIHDELVLEAPESEIEDLKGIVTRCMSGAAELIVPLKVDLGVYHDWGEAKQ
jgi:DNA polymerase-1